MGGWTSERTHIKSVKAQGGIRGVVRDGELKIYGKGGEKIGFEKSRKKKAGGGSSEVKFEGEAKNIAYVVMFAMFCGFLVHEWVEN